MISTRKLLPTV